MNQLDYYDLAPDDAVYTAIGSRLRYYRCLRGMNQLQLAEASGLSRSTIGRIESYNNQSCSIAIFIALARALRVPLENLLSDKILA